MSQRLEDRLKHYPDYEAIHHLRQSQDYAGLLNWADGNVTSALDLGCGTGALLEKAKTHFPDLRHVAGLDVLQERIVQAQAKLSVLYSRADIRQADLLSPPEWGRTFDLITMTAVLHWLYPQEETVFAYISRHLHPEGTFLLTTYHPERGPDGLGGTDDVVAEALEQLGITRDKAASLFAIHNVVPIATRTRAPEVILSILSDYFSVQFDSRTTAAMQVRDAEQYIRYHVGTFGDYYARILDPARRRDFLDALGKAAQARMASQGYVTSMDVRRWKAKHRPLTH